MSHMIDMSHHTTCQYQCRTHMTRVFFHSRMLRVLSFRFSQFMLHAAWSPPLPRGSSRVVLASLRKIRRRNPKCFCVEEADDTAWRLQSWQNMGELMGKGLCQARLYVSGRFGNWFEKQQHKKSYFALRNSGQVASLLQPFKPALEPPFSKFKAASVVIQGMGKRRSSLDYVNHVGEIFFRMSLNKTNLHARWRWRWVKGFGFKPGA